jgi:hypothetical protein
MDPFHVVALAGDALNRCRQRVQQDTCGHRCRSVIRSDGIRRVLRTGVGLLTDRQHARLTSVFTADEHAEHLRGTALGFRNLTNYITAACSTPAASDTDYTLFCDEPLYFSRIYTDTATALAIRLTAIFDLLRGLQPVATAHRKPTALMTRIPMLNEQR